MNFPEPCELCGESGIVNVGLGPELCRCIRQRLRLLEKIVLKGYPPYDHALGNSERCTHCWEPLMGISVGGGGAPPGRYHSSCHNLVLKQMADEEKKWEERKKRLESQETSAISAPITP